MPKISRMDVTIRGITRTYEFDPAARVDSGDEGQASLELLREAETTEVHMSEDGFSSASVTIQFTYTHESEVTVDLEDLDDLESIQELEDLIERSVLNAGDYVLMAAVPEAIAQDVYDSMDGSEAYISDIAVDSLFDADGMELDPNDF